MVNFCNLLNLKWVDSTTTWRLWHSCNGKVCFVRVQAWYSFSSAEMRVETSLLLNVIIPVAKQHSTWVQIPSSKFMITQKHCDISRLEVINDETGCPAVWIINLGTYLGLLMFVVDGVLPGFWTTYVSRNAFPCTESTTGSPVRTCPTALRLRWGFAPGTSLQVGRLSITQNVEVAFTCLPVM